MRERTWRLSTVAAREVSSPQLHGDPLHLNVFVQTTSSRSKPSTRLYAEQTHTNCVPCGSDTLVSQRLPEHYTVQLSPTSNT